MTTRSGRFHPANLLAIWLMVASAWQVLAVDPVVSNVQAKQREGSRLVDITYDVVDPDSPTLTVYLKVSPDGGKTWKGPVELVSGDVGQHIAPGTAKRLVWDAGKEMANQFGVKYRYKVGASDQWLVPEGMALIPAGPFQMGDERVAGATPVNTVIVSAFAIDKYEVSKEFWEDVRQWSKRRDYDLVVGEGFGVKHPVSTIWFSALKWNNARSEKEGRLPAYYEDAAMQIVYRSGEKVPGGVKWDAGFRLPTEAEWEKAARGGITGKFYPWGTDQISSDMARFQLNYGGTMPVGSYPANGYGLFDLVGNKAEWCWDLKGSYSINDQTDPHGPSVGFDRVVRGGDWNHGADRCQVAFRDFHPPNSGNGFRCVLPSGQP
jgi:formylglycine-generating enzyme required for sulfatase activity